ncbi:hypothetical protein RHGRI_038484 [Rhododendron griersonianum]|uniref:Uncharacterized protein n=1 Tax=Rhododendron griersonianum TaxID=479676 RepID=A0AAV6HJG4_9ERIC|nr:hypothetical protein RHGRI_038484 [Rhododendron griersonianum]
MPVVIYKVPDFVPAKVTSEPDFMTKNRPYMKLLGVSQQASKAFIDIMKENLAEEKAFVVTTQFCISGESPEDISNSLRKLDGLIEKGSGPQSF